MEKITKIHIKIKVLPFICVHTYFLTLLRKLLPEIIEKMRKKFKSVVNKRQFFDAHLTKFRQNIFYALLAFDAWFHGGSVS